MLEFAECLHLTEIRINGLVNWVIDTGCRGGQNPNVPPAN